MNNIIKLAPAFKDYIWGGTKLKSLYVANELERLSEAWVLSNHPAGVSQITEGEQSGLLFNEYLQKIGKKGLGTKCEGFQDFPILIKWIDAKQSLSIQVHPEDEYALRVEGEYGKTEMWYILDCEEGASLYYGVNKEITKEELVERIKNNTILEVLNEVKVHKGDVFFIEAGTIHAIGAGIVICEIQQNSNTTYRVYDFDRRDASGNPRELHIDKAVEVATLKPALPKEKKEADVLTDSYKREWLGECTYFTTHKWEVKKQVEIKITNESFLSIVVIEGEGKIELAGETMTFKKGDSLFIPAQEAEAYIKGECTLITTKL